MAISGSINYIERGNTIRGWERWVHENATVESIALRIKRLNIPSKVKTTYTHYFPRKLFLNMTYYELI